MTKFTDTFLDTLRDRIALSSLVGRHVQWDRGKSQPRRGVYWACCPFHGERTPSFRVDDGRGRYHCFGCHKDGDHFSWLGEREGLGFPEAVKTLAESAGLSLPAVSPGQEAAMQLRTRIFAMNEAAAAFYRDALHADSGEPARRYLEGRGIPAHQWDAFQLGYAGTSRSGCVRHLASLGYGQAEIIEAGLAKPATGSGAAADRFTSRLIFPIRDSQGRITGFAGRALTDRAEPKYLNSPEGPVFSKGRILWNLDRASQAARDADELIIVEGFLDVLALERAGVPHVVAPMGTAITEDQLAAAWRMADEPTICLDGDEAGRKAARRVVDIALPLLKPGRSLSFVSLGDGMDPDELLKAKGAAALAEALKARRPLVDLAWESLTADADISTPERLAQFNEAIVSIPARIPDPEVRKGYEQELTRRLKAYCKEKGLKARTPSFARAKDAPAQDAFSGNETAGPKAGRPPRQTDNLITLIEQQQTELFIDTDGEPHASIFVRDHFETWPLRSTEFRRWAAGLYYAATEGAIGGQAMEDALRVLEAKAAAGQRKHQIFRRIGHSGKNIYVDMGDPLWRAIEVTPSGWRIVDRPPCKFARSPAMRPLCEPEAGGMIEELQNFINFGTDDDFVLVVGWTIGAFRPSGPYAILLFTDEQGTGKSHACRVLQRLIDPNGSPLRSLPDKEQDVFVAAFNRWVVTFDNISAIPENMSDSLCRIATGGGVAYRKLYSDRDESYIELARPLVVNGISDLAQRPDLSSRAQRVSLRVIQETERRAEADLWTEFQAAAPRLLGAILDGVVCALANFDKIQMDRLPRMADYARWVSAAEPALGWEPGTFMRAFEASAAELSAINADDDLLTAVLKRFFTNRSGMPFHGTVSALLDSLNESAEERVRKSFRWPATTTRLGNKLRRLAPTLRAQGFQIEFSRGKERIVSIGPPPALDDAVA